jgi:hypothetical protein
LAATAITPGAAAKPPGTRIFCEAYPNAPACASGQAACTTCHSSPPARNSYGAVIEKNLAVGAPRPLSDEAYSAGLLAALRAAEGVDADGDGVTNVEEIRSGTQPADPTSNPSTRDCADPGGASGRSWDVCRYDTRYVYRKVMLDVCGRSPSFEDEAKFDRQKATLHATLDQCLATEFWRGRNGAVWNLANPKIRPVQSVKAGADAGPVPLADYDDDYALFVYTQLDNRDARDLLRATYYVEAKGTPVVYTPFTRSAVQDAQARPGRGTFQTVNEGERAGMITTRWFRVINTMFTPVPRTTAAHAYRSYLGLDISLMQGLQIGLPDPGDFDNKGIRAPGCVTCHQTLDPLSYPFSRYEALDRDRLTGTPGYLSQYRRDRMNRFVDTDGARITEVPEAGSLFGKPVANVVEWAKVASESDEFAKKLVLDYWRLLVGEDPRPTDEREFGNVWRRFRNEHAYSVNKMLHDLIDTEAYGVP